MIRVLVVGIGNMGRSHAKAYAAMPGVEIVGLVNRSPVTDLPPELDHCPRFDDFHNALDQTRPDAVSINTYTDTHADYAIAAMRAGAHVFVEKPLAASIEDAERVVRTAGETSRKLVVGYILRHHPSWQLLIEEGRKLGKPLVMRLNLNQQSSGAEWTLHKKLMETTSPLVDCGVHYVDVMCQLTKARPVAVHAIAARLSDEIAADMTNYGQLQVRFDDGSIGWYEAGWGPMMSEVAFFVKDIVGPKGSVAIVRAQDGEAGIGSSDIDSHTRTGELLVHASMTDAQGHLAVPDRRIDCGDEPDHDALCAREQAFFIDAIARDIDLTDHMQAAVDSLRVVLAADQSIKTGQVINL